MAKLPPFKRILGDDFKEVPGNWFSKLSYILNQFMDSTYQALNKGITLEDNIVSQIKVVDFTTGSAYSTGTFEQLKFKNTLGIKAQVCLIGQISQIESSYTAIETGTSVDWIDLNGTITVNYISGLMNSKKYRVTLLLF